jgi:Zn finger protein HypA/HybF involved in hydrogenase expression
MALQREQLETLAKLIVQTREHELNCDQCLTHMAELAEAALAGQDRSQLLQEVEHHLSICPECNEEFHVLRSMLEDKGLNPDLKVEGS